MPQRPVISQGAPEAPSLTAEARVENAISTLIKLLARQAVRETDATYSDDDEAANED